MERVLVLGCAGAGKSVLARQLAAIGNLPIVHLDRHYWRAGWEEPPNETWRAEVSQLLQQPRWVMDGNYSGTLPSRLVAADTVIFLDLPGWICLLRVILRTIRYFGRTRGDDVRPNCPERFDWSFLMYIWRFRAKHRIKVISALEDFNGRVIILHLPSEVSQFLREVRRNLA
jgi:adenylate kinase family enzyme